MIRAKLKSGKFMRSENGVRKTYLKGSFVEFESVFHIPDTFRNSFEIPAPDRVTAGTDEELDLEVEPPSQFRVEHRGGGKYNVVHTETGEAINDELLTKEEATSLVAEYVEPPDETELKEPPVEEEQP